MNTVVIFESPELDYAWLYNKDAEYTPFIGAWAYNSEDKTWGQGHYFRTFDEMVEYACGLYATRFSGENLKEMWRKIFAENWDKIVKDK